MAIQEGDAIPSVKVKQVTKEGPKDVTTDELFKGKKAVLFAVPGAFTPVCSEQHLPGFVARADDLKQKGVDAVYCMAVNDAFVMEAWGKDRAVGDAVTLLADGSAELAKALGLEMDATKAGLGIRAQRFAMVVDDGVVKHLAVEAPMKFEVSSAEKILEQL